MRFHIHDFMFIVMNSIVDVGLIIWRHVRPRHTFWWEVYANVALFIENNYTPSSTNFPRHQI